MPETKSVLYSSKIFKSAGEIFKKLFDFAASDLYPKLEMGARSLKGTEEDLTGETADVDKNAIAMALKKFAREELNTLL